MLRAANKARPNRRQSNEQGVGYFVSHTRCDRTHLRGVVTLDALSCNLEAGKV